MRQALKELEAEGLISRHRRRVDVHRAGAPAGVRRCGLLGSVDTIVAQQSGERTTVLATARSPYPATWPSTSPGCPEAVAFRRLRRDGDTDEPVNWAENLVHPELAERLDLDDLARWPMTKVLRDALGVRISRSRTPWKARLADPETAGLLRVPAAQPDPALHGRHVRRRRPRRGRGADPLPR
ncbi:hypothetical protein GCM10020221_30050 [Streptomyces thioluteus]|uniref:UbiC transcription regulator-associated domain-containing protein n=1 Tax=Streptomyces thioluteus TaxID=66431 RepID=A0ABN3X160_STRTU